MKKKIIIPAFALLIGAALAGSVTGTAAWYQYNSKAQVALIGAAGGTSDGNLQIRLREDGQAANAGWTTRFTYGQIETFLAGKGYGRKVLPVTPGASLAASENALPSDANGLDFRTNPVAGKGPYEKWNRASIANYVVIPLQVRFLGRDGVIENNKDEKNVAQVIYFSDITIQQRNNDTHGDISDAIRFHVSSYTTTAQVAGEKSNFLVSKNGGTTVTHGALDLDGDGVSDKEYSGTGKYGFDGDGTVSNDPVDYGAGSQVAFSTRYADVENQTYYDHNNAAQQDAKVYSLVAQPDAADDYNLVDSTLKYNSGATSKSIGSTLEDEDDFLNVDITIWVEGWQKFQNVDGDDNTTDPYTSVWDSRFIDSGFQIGFELAIDPRVDA